MIGSWEVRVEGSDEAVGKLHHDWRPDEARVLWVPIPHTEDLSGLRRVEFTEIAPRVLSVPADAPLEHLPSFVPARSPSVA